ncbi:MAG: TonB-dependent receptor [Bacteroidota bacterium]
MRKLLLWILFSSLTHFSFAQETWDFELVGVPVKEALQKLSIQSNIPIAFSSRIFDNRTRLTFSLQQSSFEEILTQILKGTGVDYAYKGQGIILRKKKAAYYNLSGYVKDVSSGERLIQASVYIPSLGIGILSNEYGYYSLKVPEGVHEVKIAYTGYSPILKRLEITKDKRLTVSMQPNLDLDEVLITTDKHESPQAGFSKMGVHSINTHSLSLAPNLLGESDLAQQIRMLPGVQSTADGFGGIHVRGGDNSQNLVMLDGVPVYNASHLMGFFSIFNSQAIRAAQLYSGGFSSKYGGRLSSVLDVHTREGNEREWNTELGIGLLSGDLLIEGPISRDRGAILVSGRNALFPSLLQGPINEIFPVPGLEGLTGGEDIDFGFYDTNVKAHYSFSPSDRLYLSYYQGGDRLNRFFEDESDPEFVFNLDRRLDWGNQIFSARWNHIFSAKLFSNLTLARSWYHFQRVEYVSLEDLSLNDRQEFFFQDINTEIRDLAANLDFSFYPNEKNRLEFGAGIIRHHIDPDFIIYTEEAFEEEEDIDIDDLLALESELLFKAEEAHIYLDHTYTPTPKVSLSTGGRLSYFQSGGEQFVFLEPRLQLNLALNKNLQLQLGTNRMVQYLHQIGADLGMPSDVWIPSTFGLAPQRAWQQEIGIQFHQEAWKLRLNAYTKQMNNLPFFFYDESTLELSDDFSDDLFQGSGKSKGIEFIAERSSGKTRGFLSYTLSKTERTFPLENLGIAFPYQYDNRHRLGLYLLHLFNPHLSASMSWNYASGFPQLVISDQDGISFIEIVDQNAPGFKNSVRNSPFHHLDIGLNYTAEAGKLTHDFKIGVYNVYNRANTSFYRTSSDGIANLPPQKTALMPILPSLRYSLSF